MDFRVLALGLPYTYPKFSHFQAVTMMHFADRPLDTDEFLPNFIPFIPLNWSEFRFSFVIFWFSKGQNLFAKFSFARYVTNFRRRPMTLPRQNNWVQFVLGLSFTLLFTHLTFLLIKFHFSVPKTATICPLGINFLVKTKISIKFHNFTKRPKYQFVI